MEVIRNLGHPVQIKGPKHAQAFKFEDASATNPNGLEDSFWPPTTNKAGFSKTGAKYAEIGPHAEVLA